MVKRFNITTFDNTVGINLLVNNKDTKKVKETPRIIIISAIKTPQARLQPLKNLTNDVIIVGNRPVGKSGKRRRD